MKAKLRDQQGLTLVELVISIAIGSLVTLAATTMLILCLRIYSNANQAAARQNSVRAAYTVIRERTNIGTVPNEFCDYNSEEKTLSVGGLVLENVEPIGESTDIISKSGDHLWIFSFTMDGHEYHFTVYCPTTD